MALPDTGYINLLAHLHRSTTTLPLPTIQASLSHYLAHLTPLPTPLAATAVSSPLFHPFSHQNLLALSTAFRHAVHLKYQILKDEYDRRRQQGLRLGSMVGGLFTRSLGTSLRQWASAVLKGLQGGQPVLRLACCGGLLIGLEDLSMSNKVVGLEGGKGGVRGTVENEVVVALAEVMDTYAYTRSDSEWENEFRVVTDQGDDDALSLSLVLSAQSLPFVAPEKLKALPLHVLSRLLTSTIETTFQSGTFLSSLKFSMTRTSEATPKIHASPLAFLPETLDTLTASPLFTSIGPLSKLTSRILSLLLDSHTEEGMLAVQETLGVLEALTKRVGEDWRDSVLANAVKEDDIADDTRELTKTIWTILKTLLFSTIMVANISLSAVIFVAPVPPPSSLRPLSFASSSSPPTSTSSNPPPNPSSLALTTLRALSHISFVISQFGGVTTTSTDGFSELKNTFYLALDIMAADPSASNQFVEELCQSFDYPSNVTGSDDLNISGNTVFQQAKKAYALASIEQLIPVLSGECIHQHAFPLCLPHLFDPSHRETFESAHSVVLAIFASHAQHAGEGKLKPTLPLRIYPSSPQDESVARSNPGGEWRKGNRNTTHSLAATAGFAERLVPFYANCLIENSVDGRLSTSQLRLAFSALIRSASASATSLESPTLSDERFSLAWLCIDSLLNVIRALDPSPALAQENEERLHRLHLTLISTVPSLPLTLLPRVLEEICDIIIKHNVQAPEEPVGISEKKKELIDALFAEILERVGDREKEYTLRWWYDNREKLFAKRVAEIKNVAGVDDQSRSGIVSRL